MLTVLITTLLAVLPATGVACERVDVVEVNHYYDECGRLVFSQLVFFEFRHGKECVCDWRLLKHPNHRPERDPRTGDWVTIFGDGETLREVRSSSFRESWTQYDVESYDRRVWPRERRAGLLVERPEKVVVDDF